MAAGEDWSFVGAPRNNSTSNTILQDHFAGAFFTKHANRSPYYTKIGMFVEETDRVSRLVAFSYLVDLSIIRCNDYSLFSVSTVSMRVDP